MSSPSQVLAIQYMVLPSRFLQTLRLKRTCHIAHAAWTIRHVTVQIINTKESDGTIIPVVEYCIRSTEGLRQQEGHMVWGNTEVWTCEPIRA